MTKYQQIQNHLREVGSITSWECIQKYNHTRLAVAIHKLRNEEEWVIHTERVPLDEGGTYARYFLVSTP